jgi:hypothetical protein
LLKRLGLDGCRGNGNLSHLRRKITVARLSFKWMDRVLGLGK